MFKNTIKLVTSNFANIWKLLIYKFLVLGVVFGLFCATLGYLNQLETFATLKSSLVSFINVFNVASVPADIMANAHGLLESLVAFLSNLAEVFPFIFVYILALLLFVLPYLWHLGDLAVSEEVFGYMSSQTKYGLTSSFIRNLNRENAYSLTVTLILLPANAIFLGGVIGFVELSGFGGAWGVFAAAFVVIWAIVYLSLRTTLLSSWAGAITTTNAKTWRGLKKALRAISRNFLMIWTTAIVFAFAFVMFSILTGVIGCAIILPLFCFIISVFGLVVFFEHRGMRYYVDFDTIIQPKKLEQTDKLSKLKYLI